MPNVGGWAADLYPFVADILREALAESGLTQNQLGTAARISQSQVSKYVRAGRVPDVNEFDRLCDTLGLDPATVISEAAAARSSQR